MMRLGLSGEIVRICLSKSKSIRLLFLSRPYVLLCLLALSALWVSGALAQEKGQGSLTVSVNKELDQQSDISVTIFVQGSTEPIATGRLGTPISLPPGTYKVAFDVLGGKAERENILVKAGRTSTAIINNIAGLQINVLDKEGKDLGITTEIYDGVSGQQLGAFLSGETILAYPGVVDVKINIPPQSHWMRQVELQANGIARMNFREQALGELRVRVFLEGKDVSALMQVIISPAGVNKEFARSEPGSEHRFRLNPGTYDILVMNPTGNGKPFMEDRVELKGSEAVEKDVELDEGNHSPPVKPLSL
jgi:uncharacterized protein (DUF2141 family)